MFDSGIGGLNLLDACVKVCPDYDFMYFADNYNVPYGGLTHGKISKLVFDVFEKIAACNPCAVVVACNTVTSLCIADLRAKYKFPILGIQPAIKQAVHENDGKCLVLATPATVGSPSFTSLCELHGCGRVETVACSSLAAYIEDHIFDYPDFDISGFLPEVSPACVVLGCTHYIFAKQSIKRYYSCEVFDGILGTADHLRKILAVGHDYNQKINFIGGDFVKNKKVYDMLQGKLVQ